jgi:hypothetical protein
MGVSSKDSRVYLFTQHLVWRMNCNSNTVDQTATEFILNQADVSCIVCSLETIEKFVTAAPKCPTLKCI